MYNSQYYTCEQIDERLLQGYVDDYNTQTGQSLTKEQFLTKLGNIFDKETVIDNTAVNIGYFICDTAAGTAAKAITAAGYALFQGGSIKVKFLNRNTAGSATLNINSQGAKALYYGGKAVSASNSWDNGEVVEIYYDGTSYYANNVEGNFKDGIFDISAYNLTEGQPTKYDTLAEALGTNGNNVPPIFRKGGMQIKYVSTSDNKYIRYNLLADSFTTDTTQWAIADEGVYVDNPEFVYVKNDKDNKILWAIKTDGGIYYGAGCPQQVKDYIEEKLAGFSPDGYEDIVAFLSDYLGSDTTLKELLDSKLDAEGLDEDALKVFSLVENPEFIDVELDKEKRVLGGRKADGTKFENLPIETPSAKFESISDPENRLEIILDTEKNIISERDKNGMLIEKVGIVAPNITALDKKVSRIEKKLFPLANGNYALDKGQEISLPIQSSNIGLKFKTNSSIYKQGSAVKLLSIKDVLNVSIEPVETEDSYYCDKSEVNIKVNNKIIPFETNVYGQDLFSIRLKYPVVEVALDGSTTMVTPMPAAFEGMYLKKTSTELSIHNSDDSIYKSWTLSGYTDVDAFVEDIKLDTSFTEHFEVIKYGCEGVDFSDINNFDKVHLCKQIDEILYKQHNTDTDTDIPTPTGATYWDSYPTIIRSSDVGKEHLVKLSYEIEGRVIKSVIVSFDGVCTKLKNIQVPVNGLLFEVPTDSIAINDLNLSVNPYKHIIVPLCSMQHSIDVSDVSVRKDLHTSTMRMYDILAYLREKKFSMTNYYEYLTAVNGGFEVKSPICCLTFDDYQATLWRTHEIRNLFNMFGAKPTLIYLFVATDLNNNNPPDYALTKEEYHAAKSCGWTIISHGFTGYTPRLTYAQFVQGFRRIKNAWIRWYGEDVCCYGVHMNACKDYQFYLLRHLGFYTFANRGIQGDYFYESNANLNIMYDRVYWFDHGYEWQAVKNQIDNWY